MTRELRVQENAEMKLDLFRPLVTCKPNLFYKFAWQVNPLPVNSVYSLGQSRVVPSKRAPHSSPIQ